MPGAAEDDDQFGNSLTVGNFDGDAYQDLVIAALAEDLPDRPDAGTATVIYGSPTGLTSSRVHNLRPDALGITPAPGSQHAITFGSALAAGDVDADGFDELAVGSRMFENRGRADVLSGGGTGVDGSRRSSLTSDSTALTGVVPGGEAFGQSLQFGQLNAQAGADLAVGMPSADLRAADGSVVEQAGAVAVFPASSGRLSSDGSQLLHQGLPGVPSDPRRWERFGWTFPNGESQP